MPGGQSTTDQAGLLTRYVINGLVAMGLHFAVLRFNLFVLHVPSAGLANLLAACFGISVSFLGNRYFVFRTRSEPFGPQFAKFGVLYAGTAVVHGLTLWAWTDLGGLDYRVGFGIATFLQVVLSFLGNKALVFNA